MKNKLTDNQFERLWQNRKLNKENFKELSLSQTQKLYNNDKDYFNQLKNDTSYSEGVTIKQYMKMSLDDINELYKSDPNKYWELNEELITITEGRAEFSRNNDKYRGIFKHKGIGKYHKEYTEAFQNDILVNKYYPLFELVLDENLNKHPEQLKQIPVETFIKGIKVDFSNKLRARGKSKEANEIIEQLNL